MTTPLTMSLISKTSRALAVFTASLPQTTCPQNTWPKASMICTNSAIACTDDTCICAEGWSGNGDFVSSNDCHLNESLIDWCILFLLSAAVANVLILSIWNYNSFRTGYEAYLEGVKVRPKTLAYVFFVWEGVWSATGSSYRLITGNKFGYDLLATVFMAGNVCFFVLAAFFFIKAWVKVSLLSSSSGRNKREANKEAKRIIRSLRYQLVTACVLLIFAFAGMMFVKDDLSVYRVHLTRTTNLCTALCATFAGMALFKSGRVLSNAIKIAGVEDEKRRNNRKLIEMANNMLKGTNLCTVIACSLGTVLVIFSVVDFLIQYQMIVICFGFGAAFLAPISMTLLLETPPWGMKGNKGSTLTNTNTGSGSGSSTTKTDFNNSSSRVSKTSFTFANSDIDGLRSVDISAEEGEGTQAEELDIASGTGLV